ncbi:uncharacterized protein [Ciconia boyciana]|uniref:uncharacterized protein n=1 Tax=Ciconia boyciana TaxID=52775 RepID=UPI0021542636
MEIKILIIINSFLITLTNIKGLEDNLILKLIQGFGKLQNTTGITTCLPIPHSSKNPIEWGILTLRDLPLVNFSQIINQQTKSPMGEIITWTVTNENCNGTLASLPNGESLCWSVDNNHERNIVSNLLNQQQGEYMYETNWKRPMGDKWRYMNLTSWCFEWIGQFGNPKNQYKGIITNPKEGEYVPEWNCTQVFNCSHMGILKNITGVEKALRIGCQCRNLTVEQQDVVQRQVQCHTETIPSPGYTVWVLSNGTWTNRLHFDIPNHQITLGVLTLCPLWKKNPLTPQLWGRVKRESNMDPWHGPSTATKVGWAMEALLAPGIMAFENRVLFTNLTWQMNSLANATERGLLTINKQVQANSEITLQNRLALDLLLAKKRGLCGYLKLDREHCCVHIPNVTEDLNKQIDQIKEVAKGTRELRESAENNWINKILQGEWSLTGWLASLVQSLIIIIIVIMIVVMLIGCMKQAIMRTLFVKNIMMIKEYGSLRQNI